jgi:hypothetical protein
MKIEEETSPYAPKSMPSLGSKSIKPRGIFAGKVCETIAFEIFIRSNPMVWFCGFTSVA